MVLIKVTVVALCPLDADMCGTCNYANGQRSNPGLCLRVISFWETCRPPHTFEESGSLRMCLSSLDTSPNAGSPVFESECPWIGIGPSSLMSLSRESLSFLWTRLSQSSLRPLSKESLSSLRVYLSQSPFISLSKGSLSSL